MSTFGFTKYLRPLCFRVLQVHTCNTIKVNNFRHNLCKTIKDFKHFLELNKFF